MFFTLDDTSAWNIPPYSSDETRSLSLDGTPLQGPLGPAYPVTWHRHPLVISPLSQHSLYFPG